MIHVALISRAKANVIIIWDAMHPNIVLKGYTSGSKVGCKKNNWNSNSTENR